MMSEKIRPHHLERKAILYIRQSSAHQVLHNRESSALQYAMRSRLTALGWSNIETVDDDLGVRQRVEAIETAAIRDEVRPLLLENFPHGLIRPLRMGMRLGVSDTFVGLRPSWD